MTKGLAKSSKLSAVEIDKLLSANCTKPTHMIAHPDVYNGHWGRRVRGKVKWLWGLKSMKFFRKSVV